MADGQQDRIEVSHESALGSAKIGVSRTMARPAGNPVGQRQTSANQRRMREGQRKVFEGLRKTMARQLAPRLCLASASACTQAPLAALLQPSRGPRGVAEARRFGIAMLVLGFGYSLTGAGHVLRRDRTTARHARDLFLAAPGMQGHRAGYQRLDPAMKLWITAMLDAAMPESTELAEGSR